MNESERDHLAGWVDDRLEAYVDGELSREERLRIEAFLEADAGAARSADFARRVRRELARTERPACPSSVTRAVLAQARAESEAAGHAPEAASATRLTTAADRPPAAPAAPVPSLRRRTARHADELRSDWRSRMRTAWAELAGPSIAVGAFVLLVVASAVIGRPPSGSDAGPDTGPTPAEIAAAGSTPAEVEQALQDAKWALHYVSDVGRRTGRSIREEVLRERVTEPVQRAVGSALDADPNS